MAHHGSTPQSVLDAPQRTYENIHPAQGLSRAERRHPLRVSFKRRLSAMGRRNTPYVKDAS